MFITGGRAGQVMFFAMLVVIVFQYFPKNAFKATLVSLFVLLISFSTFYTNSKIFSDRVDIAVTELSDYKNHTKSSTGLRISAAINSWDIIKENPIIGVGTGDYKNEFISASKKSGIGIHNLLVIHNPHNMYVLIMVQFGLVGLFSMLYMFYTQIKIATNSNEEFVRKIGIALPLLYLLIMLSDSYLMTHMTGLLFIFISSFIYKDYEMDKQYRLKTTK
jgi:O-antigen ligase